MVKPHRKGAGFVERAAETHAAVHGEAVTPLQQQADHLEKVLVPADGDSIFRYAAEAGHHAVVQRLDQRRGIANGRERYALTGNGDS